MTMRGASLAMMNINYMNYTDGNVVYENNPAITTSLLSDSISNDLKKRGMTFVGSTIIYSYLQAIGIINGHEDKCWKYTFEKCQK